MSHLTQAKIRIELVEERQQRSTLETLKKRVDALPEGAVILFQDSLDAGNCVPGTEDFVRSKNLKGAEMGFTDFLKKVPLEEVIRDTYLRRAVEAVLVRYGVPEVNEPESAEPASVETPARRGRKVKVRRVVWEEPHKAEEEEEDETIEL